MRRKIITIICIITVSLAALPMVSCGESDEKLGTFYTLQEGYDLGIVDKDDLQTIADMHNNDKNFPEPFPYYLSSIVMDTYVADNPDVNYHYYENRDYNKKPRLTIYGYYGIYDRCYAVYIGYASWDYPKFIDEWIDVEGVKFHYTAEYFEGAKWHICKDYILLWKEG